MYLTLKQLIRENIQSFNNSKNIHARLNHINLIVELMNKDERYQLLQYKYLKIWIKYYILSTERKKYSYDDVVFNIVQTKISYLKKTDERLKLLKYFIRQLNHYKLNEEIYIYEDYQKQLELILSFEKSNYTSAFLKLITYNLLSLSIILFLSLFFFTALFFLLEQYLKILDIFSIIYIKNNFFNISANLIAYLFNVNKTLEFKTFSVLICLILIKIYFYLIVTYFIVKKITRKMEKI